MVDKLLRYSALIGILGKSRTAIYEDTRRAVLPPPVQLGGGLVGWPEREIDAIVRARIAGKNEDQIRELVRDLIARRSEAA